MSKKERKREPISIGRKIILVICLMVFAASASYLADYFYKNYFVVQKEAKHLSKTASDDNGLLKLYDENSDIMGWVKAEGTRIDYPVMQTKEEPEFYLRKNFDKEYSLAGTPFMDASSDVEEPTFNWFIYGHHMKSGAMFHDLLKYEEKSFMEEHPIINLDVLKHENGKIVVDKGKYRVVAACYSGIKSEEDESFKYYQYSSYTDEEKFDEFVEGIKKESCYDTGITPEYGEQLITLSTCAYHVDNGRFYVVAVREE